jgi:hypothetical protein
MQFQNTMKSLSANHRTGLALARPVGQPRRSMSIKNIKPALPHAKGSYDNAGIDVSGINN